MLPGDIIKGKGEYKRDLYVSLYSSKSLYLSNIVVMTSQQKLELTKDDPQGKVKSVEFYKIFGMVTDFDSLGEKIPHKDGVVQILFNNKMWWVRAADLQIVKLGQGLSG